MLINFRFLKCDKKQGKLVCEGERNMRKRKIVVSNLHIDGNNIKNPKSKQFNNLGCKYNLNLKGSALDCFSI